MISDKYNNDLCAKTIGVVEDTNSVIEIENTLAASAGCGLTRSSSSPCCH
jgi:hypothetical protein